MGLDVGVLGGRRIQGVKSLGRGRSLSEVGALSKEHTQSSVLGRGSSPTREPKGMNRWVVDWGPWVQGNGLGPM